MVEYHKTRSNLCEATNHALSGYVKEVVWRTIRSSTQVLLFRQAERPVLDALRELEGGMDL